MEKIILLSFCISISTVIFAQGAEWGVKTGLNLASQTTDAFSDKVRSGIYAGLFAEHRFNKFFGIQGELLYSMMGSRIQYHKSYSLEYGDYDGYGPWGDITDTYKTDYIVLPVLAKLYVLKNLSLDLGPQFGYMVSAKIKTKAEGLKEFSSNYYDIVNRKFDVSFGMGLSYRLNSKIDISGRCNFGLTDISDYSKLKNNVIQLGVGYRIK